ncbi:MAG: bifunctional demethylmenaquinone methyltransferase/2-methoxy-6-polyprenyl-1,4-benzoquinol methylase UbiE [Anaerolineales bacterium]|nr:MAG: bifunctional demethylmenaquinone methyltransferase/2-methoxy-6-polyprenyl-1,4-benzoquinol methylase UbiE [Anaerolineales bacterium]
MQPRAEFVRAMFARIARRYDFMNHLMTLGRDRAWRRYVARQAALPQGGLALDVATGTADLALALGRHSPHGRVVGIDFCSEMINMGRIKVAAAEEDSRLRFVIGDALQLPFADGCFDAVTSGFALRNVADVPQAFAEMGRVVKAGGWVVNLEIARPTLPVFRQLFHIYFYRLVPLLGRFIAGQGEAYHYLPHSLTHFLSPEELKAVMERAGLSKVWYRRLMLGTVAVHVGVKG